MVDDPDEPPHIQRGSSGRIDYSQGVRTERPDTDAFERKLRDIDGEIFVVKGALSRIKLDAHSGAFHQSSIARTKRLNAEKAQLHEERTKLKTESLALDREFQQLTEDLRTLRCKLRFAAEDDLTRALDSLRQRQEHTASITLREEKKILVEIRDLELSRPLVSLYQSKVQRATRIKQEQETMASRARAIWAKINVVIAQIGEEEVNRKSAHEEALTEAPRLNAKLEALESARAAVVCGFEEERKVYQNQQKLVRLAEIIKKRLPPTRDKRKCEERKRHPLDDDILECDFAIRLLRRHLPAAHAAPALQPSTALVFAEGEELLPDKHMRAAQERQNFYKGGHKKKQRNKRTPADQSLPLSLEIASFLSGHRIKVPGSVAEIPATLASLQRKRDELQRAKSGESDGEKEEEKEDSGSDSTASPTAV